MASATRLLLRRIPLRVLVAGFIVLGVGLALTACGGEDPVPRQFGDEGDDAGEPTLPKAVRSQIDLVFKKGHFVVEVSADRDYCLDGRTGAIFEKPRKGRPDKVGEFKTDEVGADNVKVRKPGGSYFARLSKGSFAKYGSVSVCSPANSRTIRV